MKRLSFRFITTAVFACVLVLAAQSSSVLGQITPGSYQMCSPAEVPCGFDNTTEMVVKMEFGGEWTDCVKVDPSSGSSMCMQECEDTGGGVWQWSDCKLPCPSPCGMSMIPLPPGTDPMSDQMVLLELCPFGYAGMLSSIFPGLSSDPLDIDPENCGACGNACEPWQICSGGVCSDDGTGGDACTPEMTTGGLYRLSGYKTPCGSGLGLQTCNPGSYADILNLLGGGGTLPPGTWGEIGGMCMCDGASLTSMFGMRQCDNSSGAWAWDECEQPCMFDACGTKISCTDDPATDCPLGDLLGGGVDYSKFMSLIEAFLFDDNSCGSCNEACPAGTICWLGKCVPEQPGRERCTVSFLGGMSGGMTNMTGALGVRNCAAPSPCGGTTPLAGTDISSLVMTPGTGIQTCCNGYWGECFRTCDSTPCQLGGNGAGIGFGLQACDDSGATPEWGECMNSYDAIPMMKMFLEPPSGVVDPSALMDTLMNIDSCCEPVNPCDNATGQWEGSSLLDFDIDPMNCGGCGNVCPAGQDCVGGACVNPDNDGDGVDDIEEQGFSGTDTAFDGNNDGTADYLQSHVSSLKTHSGNGYVTLIAPASTALKNVQAVPNPSPGDAPYGLYFDYGFFSFTLTGVTPGGSVDLQMVLPTAVSRFYKYGPTSSDTSDHWYEFYFDGSTGTGAEMSGTTVTLHFVDGGRGDDDLSANGSITDDGGPVTLDNTAILLASLKVTPASRSVTIAWETGSEEDNFGFNLYRAGSAAGPYVRINKDVIPSKVGTGLGAAYSYTDSGLRNRTTYFYKLEDVDVNGKTTQHGPVSATPRLIYGN